MVFKNAIVCTEDFSFRRTDIKTNGDIIEYVGHIDEDGLDCTGKAVLPGFIDIHIHGFKGYDCTDLNPDSAARMSEHLPEAGVTSFCPATMTVPADDLRKSFRYIRETMGREKGAYIHGVNMEGPFISPEKKGAQDETNIMPPDIDFFRELNSICRIRITDIAPESDGAENFIKEAAKECTVSAAHTCADYETAVKSFATGISHCTHLFNAMTQFGSREPGLVGAVFDSESVTAEIICDGIHVAPATLRTAFRVLGTDRTVVISDATMASGLSDGVYSLGGQKVIKSGQTVRLQDGKLAGSATNLFEEFRNLSGFGIPQEQIIRSLTINPARVIGADGETGSIEPGKKADLILTDEGFSHLESTFVSGRRCF